MLAEGALLLARAAARDDDAGRGRRHACADAEARLHDVHLSPTSASTPPSRTASAARWPARRCATWSAPRRTYPLVVERPLALAGVLVRAVPPLARRPVRRAHGPLGLGHAAHRGRRAAAHRRDGLRRRLPHADPPDRLVEPQGPQQLPADRAGRPGLAVRDRLRRRRPRRDRADARHVRRLRRVRRPCARAAPWRSRSTSRCSARPTTRGSPSTRSGSRRGPTASIAYAENPPKKYQDIYPLNFDNDPAGHRGRDPPGPAGVDRPRRDAVPRRQPAHQAARLLAVAARGRRQATTPR